MLNVINLFRDINFWISLVGTLASLFGVYFSILAAKEAKEAKEAAKIAANQVKKINAVADVSSLITICKEVITHFDNKTYQSAKIRVRDILHGINKLKSQQLTRKYFDESNCSVIITELINVEEFLISFNGNIDNDKDIFCKCRGVIRRVEEELVRIAIECQDAAEEL